MNRLHLIFLLLLFPFGGACTPPVAGPASVAQMRQALQRAPAYHVQVARGKQFPERAEDAIRKACAKWATRAQVEVTFGQGLKSGPAHVPRVILGWLSDLELRATLRRLGMIRGGQLLFAGQGIEVPEDYWVVRTEDPRRPGLPLVVYLSRSWAALEAALEELSFEGPEGVSMYSSSEGFQLYEMNGRRVREENSPVFLHDWVEQTGSRHLKVQRLPGVSPKRAGRYRSRVALAMDHVETWTGLKTRKRFELFLMDSIADLRSYTGRSDLSVSMGTPRQLHVLLSKGMPDDGGAMGARWVAHDLLGATAESWLAQGAGVDAAGRWWGKDLGLWGQRLLEGQLLPDVNGIVSAASSRTRSQHQLGPARGLLFRYLRETRGGAFLVELWKGTQALELNADLNREFQAWLSELPPSTVRTSAKENSVEKAASPPASATPFSLGIALDTNGRPGGGFDSAGLGTSLSEARSLSVNSLSITATLHEGGEGWHVDGRQTVEGDVSLAYAIGQSRRSGLTHVTLQTSFLASSSAGYSAWQRRTNAVHWSEFFDEFDPAMVHFGLLAELCGIDLLSLGSGLTRPQIQAGLSPADLEVYDQRWSQLIAKTRAAFRGKLTYTADLHAECESFRHWDELDYVGLAHFPKYTSVRGAAPTGAQHRGMWDRTLERIEGFSEEFGRPVMLLELGMRSVRFGARETSLGAGPADAETQQEYFAQLSAALAQRRLDTQDSFKSLAGLYAWKWGAQASAGGLNDRSYTLQGKPAALLLPSLSPDQ